MKRSLNTREKRLLILVLGALFLVVNVFAFREFTMRRKALTTSIAELSEQASTNKILLNDRGFWEKRLAWLEKTMPYTESAGRAQGLLLEDLQNAALENELSISNQTLLEPLALDHGNEVAVSIRIRGDQEKMLRWLLTLQSPEKFQAIKSIDLELDSRAKEKTPQAQCNLTIARWFNAKAPPVSPAQTSPISPQTSPVSSPAPQEPEEEPVVNPLELSSPLDSAISTEGSAS